MEDLAYDLVRNVVKVKYDDLGEDVAGITRKFILDTLATTLAGSSAPGCAAVVNHVKASGGKKESTVLVYGGKVIAAEAALANSMMAHALDFDDTHDEAIVHANVAVLPAALAIAERQRGVSGKDLITAVAVGVDVMCRLGLGAVGSTAFVPAKGYFGATAAVGKILGLDERKLHHAMGIVYSQSAGTSQPLFDGGLVKRMQPAFSARAGVLSCMLAQAGITGAKNIFEGPAGFYPLYHGGKYSRERVLEGLGKKFEVANLSVKLYPSCRYTHAGIDAALSIAQGNTIRPEDVTEIIAHVTQAAFNLVGSPFEIRESPQVDAQFSLPYTIAIAIARRSVFVDDFSEEKIKTDTQLFQLAKKVRVVVDQESIAKGLTPCVVEVKTKDGKVYSQRVEIIRGDPRRPVAMEEIAAKFRKCAALSAKPIARGNIGEVIRKVGNLETVTDVSEIVRLLA